MKEVKSPKKPLIFYYLIALLAIMLLNALFFPKVLEQQITEVDYGTFLNMVKKGDVAEVQQSGEYLAFIGKDEAGEEKIYKTVKFEDPKLIDRLMDAGVSNFSNNVVKEPSPLLNFILSWILPVVFFVLIGQLLSRFMMKKMGGGAGAMSFGKSNAKIYVESSTGIKFADVAGEDEAKEALTEIVDFLHNPGKYADIGASMPKGALLVGPP